MLQWSLFMAFILKEIENHIQIMFVSMSGIENWLCSNIHKANFVKCYTKPTIAVTVLCCMRQRNICETNHLFMNLIINVKNVKHIVG